MGLDWCVRERENADGTTTSPAATAGALALARDNPASVNAFREVWDSHCKNALAQFAKTKDDVDDLLGKLASVPGFTVEQIEGGSDYQKHWLRSFETVLAERLAEIEESGVPVYLTDTIPADSPSLAKVSGMAVSALDFRGKAIGYMDGLPSEVRGRAYNDMEPETARRYADELVAYQDKVSKDDRPLLDAAVAWLRFWSEHGHGIHAWY